MTWRLLGTVAVALALAFPAQQVDDALGFTHGSAVSGGGSNLRQVNVCGVPDSVTPASYYIPGIATQGVSTADCYNSDGLYAVRPYDLANNFGTLGASIAAQQGRYYWPMTPDHPTSAHGNWYDGQDLRAAFGSDPQVLPAMSNMQVAPLAGGTLLSNNNVNNPWTTNNSAMYQLGFIYYDPEDTGNVFHWMGEGVDIGTTGPGIVFTGTTTNTSPIVTGIADTSRISATYPLTAASGIPGGTTVLTVDSGTQITMSQNATASGSRTITAATGNGLAHYATIFRTNNLSPSGTWTLYGPGTENLGTNDFTSFQRPTRISSGNWTSYTQNNYRAFSRLSGSPGDSGVDANGWRSLAGVSSSTDGLTFTRPEPASYVDTAVQVGTRRFLSGAQFDPVTISGQQWISAAEDARNVLISSANPAVVTKNAHGLVAGNTLYFNAPPTPAAGPYTANQTTGSNCLSGFSPAIGSSVQAGNALAPTGNVFYSAGAAAIVGISPGTTVTSVGTCSGANSVTISSNSTATATPGNFVFYVLPTPLVQNQTYYVKTVLSADTFTISATNGGAAIDTSGATVSSCISKTTGSLCNVPNGGMFVSRVAVDSSMNMLASPAPVRISNAYSGLFPGPQYIQNVNSYLESGIYTYYATRGFFNSAGNFGFVDGATYLSGNGALQEQLVDIYSECVDPTLVLCYNSAPMGLTASAAAGVVTLKWNDTRPNQNYHLYYGSSPTSQPNLIGSITGLTTTYTPNLQTPAVMYFKLVSLDASNVEQGARVVSAYVSSSTAFVNQHIARVLADGADPATIDRNWLDTVDAWLTTNSLHNSLEDWASASFGVIQNTSGLISKVYDLGTTRVPRSNDLWFCSSSPCAGASNSTYSPTGLNNTTPAWTNGAGNAFAIFGGLAGPSGFNGRLNHIRRKVEVSVFASYAKTASSGDVTLLATGEFGGLALQHLSGTPGTASFLLADDTNTAGATSTLAISGSATAPHVIGGTFGCGATPASTCPSDTSSGNLNVYADGVKVGSPTTGLHYNAGLSLATTLKGQLEGLGQGQFYESGSLNSKFFYGAPSTYVMENAQAGFTMSDLIIFSQELTPTQAASLSALLANHVTPPTAITSVAAGGIAMGSPAVYNITAMPSGTSATCNGIADDSAAFTNFKTLASAWDAANPSVIGSIVLNIPNSECMFLQGGGAIKFVDWAMSPSGYLGQARVRVLGTGTSSKLSDGGTGGGFYEGGGGMWTPADNLHQTRVATVSRGATTLNFTACPGVGCATALALFSPGAPVMLTGVDLQGFGQPVNPAFWDFLTVNTVTTTGVTTTTPITHDYKSTWPNYSTGTGGSPDQGGPGTLYVNDPTWNVSVEWNGLILDQGAGSGGGTTDGKSVVFKNDTITGTTSCLGPSVNGFFAWINVTATSCVVEVDKLIDTFVLQNVHVAHIDFQSASVKSFIASEVTASTYLQAGGINNIVANSTLSELDLGAHSYGSVYGTSKIIGNNITTLGAGSANQSLVNLRGTWSGGVMTIPPNFTVTSAANNGSGLIRVLVNSTTGWSTGMATNISISGGSVSCQGDWVLTVVDSTHFDLQGSTFAATCAGSSGTLPLNWAVPGANVYWGGGGTTQGPMAQVIDVGTSGANTTVTTSLAGAFPTMPLSGGGATVKVHSAPQLFASGNYGSAAAIDMNQIPAGAPFGSYSKVIVAAANGSYTSPIAGPPTVGGNVASPYSPYVWGQLTETDWTITAACGSASNFEWVPTNPVQILGSASTSTWAPTANALVASTTPRQMFPTTTAGAQSGDSLAAPGAGAWLLNGQNEPAYATVANCGSASTTVTTTTNQGVVNPAQYHHPEAMNDNEDEVWYKRAVGF